MYQRYCYAYYRYFAEVDIAVAITLVSSVSVLSIIVIFIICGLLCGHCLSKRPTISQSSVCEDGLTADTSPIGPVYENLTSLTNDFKAKKYCDNEKSNIDLNTNISYGPATNSYKIKIL